MRRDQWSLYITVAKAPNVTLVFDDESAAKTANAELVQQIEDARKDRRTVVLIDGGRFSIDPKSFVTAQVFDAMHTPGATVL
jgi:hypothetical protein